MTATKKLQRAAERAERRAADRERRAAERAAGMRTPLVLTATRTCIEHAGEVLPGCVVENAVGRAIAAGEIRERGDAYEVPLDGDICAVVLRVASPTGRKAWRPIAIARASRTVNRRRKP